MVNGLWLEHKLGPVLLNNYVHLLFSRFDLVVIPIKQK
jgi:hypothetical protein